MLETRECFKNGRVDANALKGFIKDIKKNTKLSDEDAAVIAASKVIFIIFFMNGFTIFKITDCRLSAQVQNVVPHWSHS